MSSGEQPLDEVGTTKEAGRAIRSCGPDWDAAVSLGVDVALLLENVASPPWRRLQRLDEMNRLIADIQARTVPEAVRMALEAQRLQEKARFLGPEAAGDRG
jgi:hypothetical protein